MTTISKSYNNQVVIINDKKWRGFLAPAEMISEKKLADLLKNFKTLNSKSKLPVVSGKEIKKGIKSAKEGCFVEHSKVSEWLNSWGAKNEKVKPACK